MTTGNSEDIEQKRLLVNYWIEKVHEALKSARDDYEHGRLSFAVNRLYYACFYSVTAVFRDMDKMFKKHKIIK